MSYERVRRCFLMTTLSVVLYHPALSQNPGNVGGGLRWWLRADAEAYSNGGGTTLATDGVAVQRWDDQSGVNNNATQPTALNRPIFRTNRLNGYPVLEFNGNQFLTAAAASGIASNESFYVFLVFKQDSYLLGAPTDGAGTFIIDRGPAETNNLMSFKMVTGNRYNYQKRNDGSGNLGGPVSTIEAPTGVFTIIDYYRIFNNSFGIYIDGRQDVTLNTNTGDAITGPPIQIGRHAVANNQGLYGEFAEIAVYDVSLTTANRRRIESYLALKYGITLDTTTPQDYFNSAGDVVYPASSNASYAPYRFDVAGIIQDNNSDLDQETSHSQNTNYVLTVSNPSGLGNGESLVWGSNNGSLTVPNDVDVDGTLIKRRLSRVWRFFEDGNPGNVTLSFDLSAVPGAKSQASLRLLIDRDDDGFADNDVAPRTGTLVGNIISFTNLNLQDDDNVTIGTTDITDTPLPVTLVDFDVKYEQPVVKASWSTANELNNDYFLLERSPDGYDFSEIARIPGKGTSNVLNEYTVVDEIPLEGRSYYRLKQVDFDGSYEHLGLRGVNIGTLHGELTISPNPTNRRQVEIRRKSRELTVTTIELADFTGKVIETKNNGIASEGDTVYYELPASLSSGSYFLRVYYNGTVESHKLIYMP